LHWLMGGTQGLVSSLIGLGAGLSILMAPYVMKLMGAGDVKLMAVVGAGLGAPALLTVFLLTSIAGGVHFSLILFIRRLQAAPASPPGAKGQAPREPSALRMCYGLSIAVGTLATMTMRFLGMDYIRF